MAEAKALVAINPNDAETNAAAGKIYFRLRKSTEALQAFDRVVQLAPTESSYLMRASYRPKKDLSGRRADIDEALKLNAKSTRALQARAALQYDQGDYKASAATFSELLGPKNDVELLTGRGIAYAKAGQTALAGKDFTAARKSSTTPAALNELCWNLATEEVALDTALAACDAAVAKEPKRAAYLDSRGFVLMRLGRYAESIAAYDEALKNGIYPASQYGRGVAKHRAGDASGGDSDIKAALASDPAVGEQFEEYGVKP